MPRAFISVHVDPSPPLLQSLHALGALGGPVRTVADQNLHITLRFLGDTDASRFGDLQEVMQEACEGAGPFSFNLRGLGAFPGIDRPSVVWVGAADYEPLRVIVNRLNPLIDGLGFGGDQRPWKPHLTLARVKAKPPGELFDMLSRQREADFGAVSVDHINLMKSTLTPGGPIYDFVHRVALEA